MIGEAKGKLVSNTLSDTGKWLVTFETEQALPLSIEGDVRITVEEWKEKRSLNQNSLMWAIIDQIAAKLRTDRWSVYLKALKDYGKVSYILVDPRAVEYLKATVREIEVMDEVEVNGRKTVQVACYHGSSTLNTSEMARLLDGVLQDAKDLGIDSPEARHLKELMTQNG